MTNFEKYKDDITQANRIAVWKNTKDLGNCETMLCKNCLFYSNTLNCKVAAWDWLKKECTEKPVLTKRERLFCEAVPDNIYITRDIYNMLYLWTEEPNKNDSQDLWEHGGYHRTISGQFFPEFKFIKWNDEKPWKVSDLLKLEVEE